MNFYISEKDIFTALSKTRYQRGNGSYSNEVKAIRTIFLETPIPKTDFLTITEKIEKEAAAPPPPKPQPKPKTDSQSKDDVYSILRQAQGITSNEGPKRGVGAVQQEFNQGMPYPMPRPGMPGIRPFPNPGMPGRPMPGIQPMPMPYPAPGAMPGPGHMPGGGGHTINGSPFATNIGGSHLTPQPRDTLQTHNIDEEEEEDDDENYQ